MTIPEQPAFMERVAQEDLDWAKNAYGDYSGPQVVIQEWIRRAEHDRKRADAAEKKLATLAAIPCRCEPAFTSRGRHASDCFWNQLRSYVDLEGK